MRSGLKPLRFRSGELFLSAVRKSDCHEQLISEERRSKQVEHHYIDSTCMRTKSMAQVLYITIWQHTSTNFRLRW